MWYWLGILCGGVFGLAVLLVAAAVLWLYLGYRRSPDKRWRDRVLKTWKTARRWAEAERAVMQRAAAQDAAEDQALEERVFRAYLSGFSVDALESYRGIGPATIDKLREAGYHSLADLDQADLQLPGIGRKRREDVRAGVRHFVKEARSQFNAGACPEADQLATQLEIRRASRTAEGARATLRYLALNEVLHGLEPLWKAAELISFRSHLDRTNLGLPWPDTPEDLLPDLEEVVRSADEQFARVRDGWPAERPPAPAAAVSGGVTGSRAASAALPGPDLFRAALQAPAPPAAPVDEADDRPPAFALIGWALQAAFAVARADGRVARKERAVIDDYVVRRCGEDRALLNRAKALAAHWESAAIDLEACLGSAALHFSVEERRDLLDLARRVAAASGAPSRREVEVLERIEHGLGLAPASPAPPPAGGTAAPPPTHGEQLALLEIDPSAALSADLVRRQFNLLAERYAPEKLEALGPEFVTMARNKLDAIRAAAQTVLEGMGERLEPPASPAEPTDLRHNPDLDAMFQ